MASIIIRDLGDDLKQRLREQAAAHGHSMEQEARELLVAGVRRTALGKGLGTRIHEMFAEVGYLDLPDPDRSDEARGVVFGE